MKFFRGLSYFHLVLVSLVAIIFAFIEFRSIFAGDFTLMQNPTSSVVGYIGRGLFYLLMLTASIILFVNKINKKRTTFLLIIFVGCLFGLSFTLFAFYVFYIALVVVIVNFFMLMITALRFIFA